MTLIHPSRAFRDQTLRQIVRVHGVSPGFDTSEGERTRRLVNEWIRAHCDTVADLDHALHDPAAPTVLRPAYDSGDHIHPNDAGAEAMADLLAGVIIASA
ncbi:SGNH/GDSL hydrolase family protein [Streptosporangium subroseum]|uniref:SGNH/GDSL hydrolase family protein n=1 Tax=Streptosporangium subroseum TaxID=106412 RepID=UPI00342B5CAC